MNFIINDIHHIWIQICEYLFLFGSFDRLFLKMFFIVLHVQARHDSFLYRLDFLQTSLLTAIDIFDFWEYILFTNDHGFSSGLWLVFLPFIPIILHELFGSLLFLLGNQPSMFVQIDSCLIIESSIEIMLYFRFNTVLNVFGSLLDAFKCTAVVIYIRYKLLIFLPT